MNNLQATDTPGNISLPHTGLLREETLVLRHLFAYGNPAEMLASFAMDGRGSRLQGSSIMDFLFVCIDIDTLDGYDRVLPHQQFHIGVSILDSRSLSGSLNIPTAGSTDVITSYQFHTGDSKYCRRASNRFLYGRSEAIHISALKPRLEALVSSRDVVLVMHGDPDIKVLKNLDIDLQPLYSIDTVKAAQYSLRLSRRISLEQLLTTLDVPYTYLHAAGNDAHFILRALLMIVVKDAELVCYPIVSLPATVNRLRAIAQAPRPPTPAEIRSHVKGDPAGTKIAFEDGKEMRRKVRIEQKEKALQQEDDELVLRVNV